MGEPADGQVVDAGRRVRRRVLQGRSRPEDSSTARPATSATASSVSAGVKLSSRIRSAPASRTSPTWCSVSTSTSIGTSGNSSRTALKAWATPPTATTWLSFTRAASESDMRWLTPPPQRTAYFSRARRPAVVLRVSRTLAFVPSRASAHARVAVAMPERRHRRLSALRSPVSRSRVRAVTLRSVSPASTRAPSSTCRSTSNSSVQTIERTASATRRPATTAGLAGGEVGGGDGVLGDGRHGRHVHAAVEVLGDREVGDVLDLYGVEAGCPRGARRARGRARTRTPRCRRSRSRRRSHAASSAGAALIWIRGTSTGSGRASSGVVTYGSLGASRVGESRGCRWCGRRGSAPG